MKTQILVLTAILAVGALSSSPAQTKQASSLRVGAAKVDITPDRSALPATTLGILDKLNVRAIVIDNGATSAALVSVDTGAINDGTWRDVSQRVEKELGIPAGNVFMTATHTHSSGRTPNLPEGIFQAVKTAKEKLQPARMGYGTGVSYLNVQRDYIDPKTRNWWEGANYDGPSDKTVAVIKFETPAGEPIAVYYNYAMHAVITGTLDMVSADAPGAASNYIEDSFDNKVVALWSTGAEGDQNPIYFQQTFDLRDIRIKDYAKRGQDISNAMPPGGQGMDRENPAVVRLMNQQKQMILTMGQMLGEEVKRVMRLTDRTVSNVAISSNQKTVTCPGRQRTDGNSRAGSEATYKDANPVDLRLSLLMLGDVAIAGVPAEVYSGIETRLKKESPYARTIMVTLTNGSAASGYIPDDASYGHYTFEVLSSRLKPGCAESAIVNGELDMMAEGKK